MAPDWHRYGESAVLLHYTHKPAYTRQFLPYSTLSNAKTSSVLSKRKPSKPALVLSTSPSWLSQGSKRMNFLGTSNSLKYLRFATMRKGSTFPK